MASLSPLMREILQGGGTVELTVTGNSMWPMLRHKVSRVRLKAAEEYRQGVLPLYQRNNGQFVLHRIVEAGETLDCCGDNQWHIEQGLRPDQMIAVVTHFARKNHWVSTECPGYRIYWRFWLAVRPLRRLVFGGLKRIRRCLGRILK